MEEHDFVEPGHTVHERLVNSATPVGRWSVRERRGGEADVASDMSQLRSSVKAGGGILGLKFLQAFIVVAVRSNDVADFAERHEFSA